MGFTRGNGVGLSLSDLQAELDARNIDLTRMNRLDENVSLAKQKAIIISSGTFIHADLTTEQDVLEFLLNDELIEVKLDLGLLTQTTTVRVREKTDGTTYEIVQSAAFPADFDGDIVILTLNGAGQDMKITLQSAVLEGATRNIPHSRIEELRG